MEQDPLPVRRPVRGIAGAHIDTGRRRPQLTKLTEDMSERDGIPLPGRTVPDVVSQLAFHVLGPYKNRARSVLDWAGLRDQQPRLRRDVATSYGVTPQAIGQRIRRVAAAGARLPLHPTIEQDLLRAPLPGENPEVRRRCALLLGSHAGQRGIVDAGSLG